MQADDCEEIQIKNEVQSEISPTQTEECENELIDDETKPDVESDLPLESQSEDLTDEWAKAECASNSEPLDNTEAALEDSNINTESESNLIKAQNSPTESNEEVEQNEDSESHNTVCQSTDVTTVSQSPNDKTGNVGCNKKHGFRSAKNCDKYGWPAGSRYFTEEKEPISTEINFAEDEDIDGVETEENEKDKINQEANQQEEEILFVVTSPVHKRANTKRTVIKVEEVDGAITSGIHAGTHLPHFLTYLSKQINFRLTLSRFPDKRLKITIRFSGKGGETLRNIVCLWLRHEDEDKDKIICEGLNRNKEEMLILLAQKFHEMEHLKEEPIELYEEIKQLVPELRGKEGLKSKDEKFLQAYQELDDKLRILIMLLYREGCGKDGSNHKALSQFRDMYFSLQIKPGFTIKQYLWAVYYYNLVFSPYLPRDLEQMMQKYAALKKIALPDSPPLTFPPIEHTTTSTVINPFAKKNLQSPKQGNLSKENSYAEYEMVPVNSNEFIAREGEQFKKPATSKSRKAPYRWQARQRSRKIANAKNNRGDSPNQRNNPRFQTKQKNLQNQRRNFLNQRANLSNQRYSQEMRNLRNEAVQRNVPNSESLPNQRRLANQRNPASKRRQINQGGLANKRRPMNRGAQINAGNLLHQGDASNAEISANSSRKVKTPSRKSQRNQQNPLGQRGNPSDLRNNLPDNRNSQPDHRDNQPNYRNTLANQRKNQPSQRDNQSNQRNNRLNERNNLQSERNNRSRNSRSRRRSDFRKRGLNQEQNFTMSDTSRNQEFSSLIAHELLNNLRNQEFMQQNLRNQDFECNQSFNNQRNQSFTQSGSRNQSFSQGNHSRGNNFTHSSPPRSLFSQQDFFDMPRNHSYSQNSSHGQNFSQQSPRRPFWSSDYPENSQTFFSESNSFSNRSNMINRGMDDMQISPFNSRMSFKNEMGAQYFSNSTPNKKWDDKSSRGKRKNFQGNWANKRQMQGT